MELIKALRLRAWIGRLMLRLGLPSDWFLIPLAAGIGVLAGVAAEGHGQLVLLSERSFSHFLQPGLTTSRWGLLVILFLPALGGLIVGLVKAVFALPTVRHGAPEVIESLARPPRLPHEFSRQVPERR
jgi:H+/Cl- antiporter ClcA